MKFGQQLRSSKVSEIKEEYFDYKRLKKLLGLLSARGKSNSTPFSRNPSRSPTSLDRVAAEAEFFDAFKEEVDKVESFFLSRMGDIRTEFQHVVLQAYQLKYHSRPPRSPPISPVSTTPTVASSPVPQDLLSILHTMSAELHVLSTNYLPLCRTAVAKIIKKHDKIASELPQSAETVRTREAVIWTIENERSFWSKGGRLVEEMEGEVKNLQWELTKYTVRGKQDAIVW